MTYTLLHGDNRTHLKTIPDNSIDTIITDPPYGIDFLGKAWDADTGSLETYTECLRVLKPGGYILAFSAARTYHHLAINIERAGFEIRDQIMWVYGSGFPKSQDVGRAIDKRGQDGTAWSGWGSALKPAHEPIVMARKPFKGSLVDNVQEHGVGALNIDACRVGEDEVGRFPANLIHDGSEEVVSMFPNDSQRFFYCPKVSRDERNVGCENITPKYKEAANFRPNHMEKAQNGEDGNPFGRYQPINNNHPTVKPVELMKYLVRLVAPENSIILDPFMGSGSTGMAAVELGYDFIGIDQDEHYCDIARARIEGWIEKHRLDIFNIK